jgi:flagellar motor switch protein FliN/FliY
MNDNIMFNPDLDAKIREVEEEFVRTGGEILSSTLNREVKVSLTKITSFDFKGIKAAYPKETVFATVPFSEGFEGNTLFVFSPEAAAFWADILLGGDGEADFNSDEHIDANHELLNQLMTEFGRTMSSMFDRTVDFRSAKAVVIDLSPSDFQDSNWVQVHIQVDAGKPFELIKLVSWSAVHEYVADTEEAVEDMLEAPESAMPIPSDYTEGSEDTEIQLLMDIDLPITIELGRTEMMIRDILKLGPGSIVELDKLSGEPVDLFVNNKKFATGEVVVIDENFGVRITEIVRVDERIRNLEG